MISVNKKLWSFLFGVLISMACVWLVVLANKIPIPAILSASPETLTIYFSELVTIVLSVVFTYMMIILMREFFNLCPSEHPFWLLLPVCIFIIGLFSTNHVLLITLLCAACPALLLLSLRYWSQRFKTRRIFS